MDFSQHVEFQYPGRILTIVEPLESCFVNVFVDSLSTIRLTLLAVDPTIGSLIIALCDFSFLFAF